MAKAGLLIHGRPGPHDARMSPIQRILPDALYRKSFKRAGSTTRDLRVKRAHRGRALFSTDAVGRMHSATCGSGVAAVAARPGLLSGPLVRFESSPCALCMVLHYTRTMFPVVVSLTCFVSWTTGHVLLLRGLRQHCRSRSNYVCVRRALRSRPTDAFPLDDDETWCC
ncbi:uncharacterized protein F5Z01DRAFT_140180 [Emericellopsis atlantica]|uniref:Uncharacterized protein n=1 Tax=Emericellopsis atlantica TaxID=2614577 RepID=A0A9P7ZL53_9HYPO|nr:uncharacterized protein F5Z01DRAFT_140180 [Emericellopsis atlantica]KAG9253488.1 hypothetical protein F5Z01DRAFT_140180 [Emericellopsis atlantica]